MIQKILKSTDFENLKALEQKKGFEEANRGNFFREGKRDQWKKVLTNAQIQKIENKFRDFMIKFRYD